jgi:uncharacterized membrane protein YkgB
MKIKSHISILSVSIGIVYLWFGTLKFFPGMSPAEALASETIAKLTFHLLEARVSLILLAIWECVIGCLFVLNIYRKIAIPLAFVHILLTFSPMLLLPEKVFNANPLMLTLTGQYIVKNLIIISVLFALWKEQKGKLESGSPIAAN